MFLTFLNQPVGSNVFKKNRSVMWYMRQKVYCTFHFPLHNISAEHTGKQISLNLTLLPSVFFFLYAVTSFKTNYKLQTVVAWYLVQRKRKSLHVQIVVGEKRKKVRLSAGTKMHVHVVVVFVSLSCASCVGTVLLVLPAKFSSLCGTHRQRSAAFSSFCSVRTRRSRACTLSCWPNRR